MKVNFYTIEFMSAEADMGCKFVCVRNGDWYVIETGTSSKEQTMERDGISHFSITFICIWGQDQMPGCRSGGQLAELE